MTTKKVRFGLVAGAVVAAAVAGGPGARVLAQGGSRPLTAADFAYSPPRGFGDRSNSWPQSMVWWHDHLYVGTARESLCTSLFSLHRFIAGIFGEAGGDIWMPYPPKDPDLACAPDGADLPIQAEIWRWTP